MGHYGNLYDYVIHVALIATLCVSLTISSKPPLVISCQHLLVSSTSLPENQLAASLFMVLSIHMYVTCNSQKTISLRAATFPLLFTSLKKHRSTDKHSHVMVKYKYNQSTKLHWNLYCYKSVGRVTMPMATSE